MAELRWERHPDVAWTGDATRYALVDTASNQPLPVVLTGSGAAIWATLDAPRSVDEIVSVCAEVFGVQPAAISADVVGFLDELERQGLARVSGDPGDPRM